MISWTHRHFVIHEFDELKSTNSYAFEQVNSNKISDCEIILALSQSAGKGRQERQWSSPKGNLYFSLVLKPKIPAQQISQISFVGITALRIAIEKFVKNSVQNKWPNDLLIDGKKVAGILLESKIFRENAEFVILGIGVNINSNPDNTIFPATNLKNFGVEISPQELLKKFLNEFEEIYQTWLNFDFGNIRKLWLQKAYRLNEEVTIKLEEKELKGIFEDFDKEGNLVLRTTEKILKISSADVS